jgi:hypothetical protein
MGQQPGGHAEVPQQQACAYSLAGQEVGATQATPPAGVMCADAQESSACSPSNCKPPPIGDPHLNLPQPSVSIMVVGGMKEYSLLQRQGGEGGTGGAGDVPAQRDARGALLRAAASAWAALWRRRAQTSGLWLHTVRLSTSLPCTNRAIVLRTTPTCQPVPASTSPQPYHAPPTHPRRAPVVGALPLCAITAAHQEDVLQLAGLDRINHLVRHRQHRLRTAGAGGVGARGRKAHAGETQQGTHAAAGNNSQSPPPPAIPSRPPSPGAQGCTQRTHVVAKAHGDGVQAPILHGALGQ